MERWREGFHQKGKIYPQDVFLWGIQGGLKLLDASHKVTQYMYQPASEPYSICLSVPKLLYS